MKVSSKFFYFSLVVLILGTVFFIFSENLEAREISLQCEPWGGISHNYKCVGTPPSGLICVPLGNCNYAQCRDRAKGDTARFGEDWYCCNASQPSSQGNCNISKINQPIDLLNPPACEPDQKKPHIECKEGTFQSVNSCGVDSGELGEPCEETAPAPGTTKPSEELPSRGLEVTWPNSPMGTPLNKDSNLVGLIKYLYEWGIGLGGLAAFIALVIAGFQYLTSVGDAGKMSDAMKRMQSTGLGLVLLFGSWLVLNTINPQLTTLRMPSFEATPSDFTPETEDPSKNMLPCKKVEIYSATNFESPLGEVKEGECKPTSGTAEINSIKISGSCTVEFYSNECKNRDLIHVVNFLATKEKPSTTEKEYSNLEKDISYEENTVRRVKVKEIKF